MSVFGNSADADKFLRNLDEKKLLDLCADLLTLQGHTDIKITDGPGDGQRDMHSKDRDGVAQLTQSKFHGNPSHSVAPRELGEVVLGMVKYGYKKGMFITNSRISPQSKRECLSDFPGLTIEFVDGLEIVKRVFGNLILKAIWFDGRSIEQVSYTLVIPFIVRDVEIDRPIQLLPFSSAAVGPIALNENGLEAQVIFRLSVISTSLFEPYSPPSKRTTSESVSMKPIATEAIVSGHGILGKIDDIRSLIARIVVQQVQARYKRPTQHIAVRLGKLFLTPLSGEFSGARLELEEHFPITFLYSGGDFEHEIDRIVPNDATGWYSPSFYQVSTADWVRWYNPSIDACLEINLLSVPSEEVKGSLFEQREYFLTWWHKSLFMMLTPQLLGECSNLGVPLPSHYYSWQKGEVFCVWAHPNLNTPVRGATFEPDDLDEEETLFSPYLVSPEQVAKELLRIRVELTDRGAKSIEPTIARHMLAIVERDPYPNTEVVEYRPVDLLQGTIIPSPINPRDRSFTFTICWSTSANITAEAIDKLTVVVDESIQTPRFSIELQLDTDTANYRPFIISFIKLDEEIGLDSTNRILEDISDELSRTVDLIEEILNKQIGTVTRSTKFYWEMEIGLSFRAN